MKVFGLIQVMVTCQGITAQFGPWLCLRNWGQELTMIHALRKPSVTYILGKQDQNGRWSLEYSYKGKTWVDFGANKQPNKWVTYRALWVIKNA